MALKAIIQYINRKPIVEREIGKFIERAVAKSTRVMEGNVKKAGRSLFYKRQEGQKRKHERTGHLIRSVQAVEKTKTGSGEIRINPMREGADVNYGVYVEFGTKYMTPRPFIRTGVANSEKRIKQIFAEEARKVHDNATGGTKKQL